MTSLEYYIEQIEQFISALTDDIESGEGTVVTQTKLAVYREVLEHLEEIEQSYNSIKTELKPCEDAISRQAVLDAIDVKAWEFCDYLISKNRNDEQKPVSHFADTLRECVREELPSVEPQPETGHWRHYEGMLICSECGSEFYDDIMEYCGDDLPKCCPDCGAKMVEPQERSEV